MRPLLALRSVCSAARPDVPFLGNVVLLQEKHKKFGFSVTRAIVLINWSFIRVNTEAKNLKVIPVTKANMSSFSYVDCVTSLGHVMYVLFVRTSA